MRHPPPRSPRMRTLLLIVVISLCATLPLALGGCCGIVEDLLAEVDAAITLTPPDSETPTASSVAADATRTSSDDEGESDQARIVALYGMPDTFTATYDADEDIYVESWDYYSYGVSWLFNNGVCTGFDVCTLDETLTPYMKLWPGEISPETTLEEIGARLGQPPQAGIDIDPVLAGELGGEDLSLYWFDQGIMAIFEGDALRYLSTKGTTIAMIAAPEGEEG